MKKIIIFIFLFFITLEVHASVDFLVKRSSSGDETYTNSMTQIANNTSLTFQILTLGGTTSKSFQVSFPTGWSYNNHNSSGNCTTNITNTTNSNLVYTFSGNDSCLSILTFTYTPTTAPHGNNQINIIHNSSNISQVTVGITANNTLLKALSKDQNNNGFIDGYEIHFSSAITNTGAINGLTVGGQNVKSYSGNTFSGIINFDDNIFNSGETPQILSSGIVFSDVGQILNNSVTEEDTAKPILLKVNNQNISGSNNVNIGTGNIVFDFSEKLHPTSTEAFSIKKDGNNIAGNFTLSDEKLTFTPNSSLSAGNYILTSTTEARDWSNNGNSLEQLIITLVVNDITAPTGLSLGDGIGIMINNGSVNTTNRYVQLNLLATDDIGVEKMWISNNSDFSSGNWENYATTKNNWLLNSGNGTKNVYVRFRDAAGNISSTYQASINYEQSLSYLNFDEVDNIYTNNTTITLSGGCNNVNEFGTLQSTTINFSVNETYHTGTITCSSSKNWNHTFNLQTNQTNTIKISYGVDYNVATIKNSINIINPIPTCQTVTNGVTTGIYPTCEFNCNTGYRKVGNSCIADTRTFTCSAKVANSSWNSVSSYTQTWNGTTWTPPDSTTTHNTTASTTTCRFICNSGYTWNGTICAANVVSPPISGGTSGGGGGGGGAPATCSQTQLECKLYQGSYIWQRKTGVSCNGGELLKSCSIEESKKEQEQTETTNNNDNNQTDTPQTENEAIQNITQTINNLINISPKSLHKLINNYGNKLNYEYIDYFIAVNNSIKNNYELLVKNYQDLFMNVNTYLQSKDKNILLQARENYINYDKYYKLTKDGEFKYISKSKNGTDIIYQTNIEKLKPAVGKIEKIIINKYKKLLSSQTISKKDYDEAIKNYNDFIFYLSVYRIDKTNLSKSRAKEVLQKVLATYNLKIKKQIISQPSPLLKPQITLVKNIYKFDRDLKFGDYNDDVKNLQSLLKHYNYFSFETTGYFGNGTNDSLKKFVEDKLNLTYPGNLNATLRNKILELEY